MQPDSGRLGLIEKEGGDSLSNIGAQSVPGVTRGEDVMRKAFRYIAAASFLRHAEYNFHGTNIRSKVAGKQDFSQFQEQAPENALAMVVGMHERQSSASTSQFTPVKTCRPGHDSACHDNAEMGFSANTFS